MIYTAARNPCAVPPVPDKEYQLEPICITNAVMSLFVLLASLFITEDYITEKNIAWCNVYIYSIRSVVYLSLRGCKTREVYGILLRPGRKQTIGKIV